MTAPTVQAGRHRPVCVITSEGDVTADRVVRELTRLDTPVLRLDLADFPRTARLDAALHGGRWTGTLTVRDRTVALQAIGAVLWWHPGRPAPDTEGLTDDEATWIRQEANAGFTGTLAALDCLHVNHPAATMAAQSKPGMLARAARCGLNVPATWTGNHPAGARAFAANAPGAVVAKSLYLPGIVSGGSRRAFFTQPVAPHRLDDSVAACAHQLQHAITKDHEVRLVIVGEELVPVRIDAHSDAARADFRADYDALTYAHTTVPDDVRAGVSALMDHYRLLYAALDLLVDTDGRWWLVDVNPAGQYDWLQHELPGLDITGALARLLAHRAPLPHPAARPLPPSPATATPGGTT